MKSLVPFRSALITIAIYFVLGCFSSALADDSSTDITLEPGELAPPTYRTGRDSEYQVWNPREVDDFELKDQTGKTFTKKDLLGKPWIVNFVFTRCKFQCPMTCRKIMEFNQEIEDVDVRLVTITVDPEHDDVQQLKQYATIWQAEPERWIFATGDPEDVWKLIRKGFKVTAWEEVGTQRIPGYEFAHDNNIIHIDAEGKIVGRYDSVVRSEMVTLKKVLQGKIETPEEHRPAVIEAMEEQAATVDEFMKRERKTRDPLEKLPAWAKRLPATNAMLNGLATLLLLVGFTAIKAGRRKLHKQLMLYAFGVSIAFLGCYLTYHYALHHYAGVRGKPFEGTGTIRTVYFSILISHVILAAMVPVLTIVTIVKGLRERWETHRRWARVTFPIWLYVSVTGVIIYWMLYEM